MRDLAYIRHMLLNATKITSRTEGLNKAAFDANEDLQIIFSHLIQTMGESARRVSPEFRANYPSLPWKEMSGIRNKIVHDYLDVDMDVLWEVVTRDVLPLIEALRKIVSLEAGKGKD